MRSVIEFLVHFMLAILGALGAALGAFALIALLVGGVVLAVLGWRGARRRRR